MTTEERRAKIAELRGRIAEHVRELEQATPLKRGTDWWLDREREIEWLKRVVARLERRGHNGAG